MEQATVDALAPVDRRLLRTMAETGPHSPTVVADRCPVPVEAPRTRCVRLARTGLVERVTPEPVFRLTEDGRQLLAATSGSPQSVTGD